MSQPAMPFMRPASTPEGQPGKMAAFPARQSQMQRQGQAQWVMCQIGALRCILPQQEVCAVESASDVLPADDMPAPACAKILYARQAWPVYCLSEHLEFLPRAPEQRRACLVLAVAGGYFGLLCDDARVMHDVSSAVQALPRTMQIAHSPLSGLLQIDTALACVSNSAQLALYAAHAAAVSAHDGEQV